ncbi:hypothetical protein MLD38_005936 [Melastoma candidum]|nr:hypothetical protein MLD38_005936 [Melastoma candidum]
MAVLVRQLSRKTKRVEQLEQRSNSSGSFSARQGVTSPICSSPARSFPSSPGRMSPSRSPRRAFYSDTVGEMVDVGGGGRRSWRPNLDPIREKSFNRRSESDVLEQQSVELSTGQA